LQHAVDAMVARRGAPGVDRHSSLRRVQAGQARPPTYHAISIEGAQRFAPPPPAVGVHGIEGVLWPVGSLVVPEPIRRVARRAMAGTVDHLAAAGLVPSAEILAELVPQFAATVVAAAYGDPMLRTLMAAHYRAFRSRRSLLLLDFERQVRIDE